MQVCLLQRSGKFRSKFSLVTFSPKYLWNLLMISALVSKMCWIEKKQVFGWNENNKICFWNCLTFSKVGQFRNVFLVSSILLKNEQKNQLYYYGTSSQIVFVRVLGELKTPKRHFEINWPLVVTMHQRRIFGCAIYAQKPIHYLVT